MGIAGKSHQYSTSSLSFYARISHKSFTGALRAPMGAYYVLGESVAYFRDNHGHFAPETTGMEIFVLLI